jgi:chromosome segregation ATPase
MAHPFSSLRRIRRSIITLVSVLILTSAGNAFAQFRDVQDKGWSGLKDGYGVLSSMCDNKSNRTRDNFDTALRKILSSMADMSPSIDKMGDKVDDQDKSYATGLRDNIRSAWKGVAEAHEKARRAYDDAKDSPDKLAELTDELTNLKKAIETYETACKAAYSNYKSRWDDLKKDVDTADSNMKNAKDKVDSLDRKSKDVEKDITSLIDDLNKLDDDKRKLSSASVELWQKKDAIRDRLSRAITDRKADDYNSAADDYKKACQLNLRVIELQVANIKKRHEVDDKYYDKDQDLKKVEEDTNAALDDMSKAVPLPKLQRFSLWDNEFPGKDYSFKTLR